jgi:hypothetical protein
VLRSGKKLIVEEESTSDDDSDSDSDNVTRRRQRKLKIDVKDTTSEETTVCIYSLLTLSFNVCIGYGR